MKRKNVVTYKSAVFCSTEIGPLAQVVEHLTFNQVVRVRVCDGSPKEYVKQNLVLYI